MFFLGNVCMFSVIQYLHLFYFLTVVGGFVSAGGGNTILLLQGEECRWLNSHRGKTTRWR
jgi:hypothetical protein